MRRRLLISGRVQGVWFRAECRDQARRLDVAGRARNLADGRVEVILEGTPDAVAAVESWCHTGPGGAHVTSVVGEDEEPVGTVRFDIG